MKRILIVLFMICILVLTFPASVSAAGNGFNFTKQPPSWGMSMEIFANGEVWYAYGIVNMKQFEAEKIEVGDLVMLTTKSGAIKVKIVEILNPLAASDPRSPNRIWFLFEEVDGDGNLPCNLGELFKRWGPF